jgi:hypothetical protein
MTDDDPGLADLVGDLRDLREHYDLDAVSVVKSLPDGARMVVTVGRGDDLTVERVVPS